MAKQFLTPIDLTGLEILNVRLQNLGSGSEPVGTEGKIFWNTTTKKLGIHDGTGWTYPSVIANLDSVPDSATRLAFLPAERTKLAACATGSTANSTDAFLLARANHTGTQSADTVVDGTTNKAFTAVDDTKLGGIATGATANSTDAQLRDRSTHTGITDVPGGGTGRATSTTPFGLIAAGTTATGAQQTLPVGTSGQILKSNGSALPTWQTGASSDVGLGNVDNTSDVNKPVSTAQATAIGLKVNTSLLGATSGVATLDATTKIPIAQIPTVDVPHGGTGVTTLTTPYGLLSAGTTATGVVQTLATGTAGWLLKSGGAGVGAAFAAGAKADVGLANVDNTADTAKPVSTAQQTALNLLAPLASPTFTGTVNGVTKAMVGLANVDNTTDVGKPVSTAQATAIALKANIAAPAFTGTVTGITSAMVGLGNVDNTSDANKPVSTAQATADTAAKARANHTGTQSADTIVDGTTNHAFTAVMDGKLAGVAAGATANSTDATLLNRANHTGTQAAATISDFTTAVRSSRLDQMALPTAAVAMNGQKMTGMADPTQPQDSATKAYVDAMSVGLDVKASVRVATTANITLSAPQTIDTVGVVAGDRVLVKNQGTATQNGIYLVASGAWTRAGDFNSSAAATPGAFAFVEEGGQADTGWVLSTNGPITLDTTPLAFAQFSGAGAWTAGDGMTQTGTTFNVVAGNGISVAADSVAINTAVVVCKYAVTVGGTTSIAVTHNLGTKDVTFSVRMVADDTFVECDAVSTSVNVLTLGFAVAPAAASIRVVVQA